MRHITQFIIVASIILCLSSYFYNLNIPRGVTGPVTSGKYILQLVIVRPSKIIIQTLRVYKDIQWGYYDCQWDKDALIKHLDKYLKQYNMSVSCARDGGGV